ncbi:MAG TPA: hypothetical protein VK894_07000 [Jiangellales bacterium]|nr:hypothetical protein [Jiangellales bacterium]
MSERRTYGPGAHRSLERQTGQPGTGSERRHGPATAVKHGGAAGPERRGEPGEAIQAPDEHGEDYISDRDLLDREP